MSSEMPNCRVQRVRNAGHALFIDQPVVFYEEVNAFLKDLAARTPLQEG